MASSYNTLIQESFPVPTGGTVVQGSAGVEFPLGLSPLTVLWGMNCSVYVGSSFCGNWTTPSSNTKSWFSGRKRKQLRFLHNLKEERVPSRSLINKESETKADLHEQGWWKLSFKITHSYSAPQSPRKRPSTGANAHMFLYNLHNAIFILTTVSYSCNSFFNFPLVTCLLRSSLQGSLKMTWIWLRQSGAGDMFSL